jgi:hypothetical protein
MDVVILLLPTTTRGGRRKVSFGLIGRDVFFLPVTLKYPNLHTASERSLYFVQMSITCIWNLALYYSVGLESLYKVVLKTIDVNALYVGIF